MVKNETRMKSIVHIGWMKNYRNMFFNNGKTYGKLYLQQKTSNMSKVEWTKSCIIFV